MKCNQCKWEATKDDVSLVRVALKSGGYHLKASCPDCGSFIKFIGHEEPMLHFGKHRGKTITQVAKVDKPYLKWLGGQGWLRNNKLKAAIRECIEVQ